MVTTTCVHIIKIIPYYENNVIFNSSITIKMIVKWNLFVWIDWFCPIQLKLKLGMSLLIESS
jgi:hypothetical protein